MPVKIDSIAFKNRFRTESVDWLLANVGDRITIEYTFSVKTFAISSSSKPFIVNAKDGLIGDGWIVDKRNQFTEFKIGDTVYIKDRSSGASGTYTIVNIDGTGKIQVNSDILSLGDDIPLGNLVISVSSPITALRYKWNFIENNESPTFLSKVSGTEHQLVIKSIDANTTTVLPMIFLGEQSYQTGTATAQGVSISSADDTYTSKFKIIHNTTVTPYMLSEQWEDLKNGVLPDYYFNNKCLKAIFDIQATTDYTNPNWIQQLIESTKLGNTGGYGENFNTGLTNYSIDSVVFTDTNSNILDAVELTTNETNFTIAVKNTTDTPFSNSNTKIELQFLKAPYDPSEYQLNGRTIDQNFVDDRCLLTLGASSINGDKFGTPGRQVFKSVQATYVSSSEITITGKVALLSSTSAVFAESEEPRYIFNLAVQKHSLATDVSDLVRLPVSVAPFYVNVSDPGLITIENVFVRHPEIDPTVDGFNTLTVFPEDEVVAYSLIQVNKNGRETDSISLSSLTAKIKAKNTVTGDEFILDQFPLSLSGLPLVNDVNNSPISNQFIDFSLDQVFNIPTDEIRKKIKVKRRSDLDFAKVYYYDVTFPFLVRWEYWQKLTGVDSVFFNTNESLNGENHEWIRYGSITDWDLYYELVVIADKNGNTLTYNQPSVLSVSDYDTNAEWNPNDIKTYDPDTLAELVDVTGKRYLLGYKDTLVKAIFTNVTGVPDLTKSVINLGIELHKEGGIEGKRRMSTRWPSDSNTWFKSIDLTSRSSLELSGTTLTASALVAPELLPFGKKIYSLSARLYSPVPKISCICPPGYVPDPTTGKCNNEQDCCDPGFTQNGNTCEKITSVSPTFNGNTYTIAKGNQLYLYGMYGAIFFMPDNTTIDQIVNTPTSIWSSHNTSTQGRVNIAGVWTTVGTNPINQWVGFSQCLEFAEAKTVFVALAGDNNFRFKLNGQLIAETPLNGGLDHYEYVHIYEANVTAGTNIIEIFGRNDGQAATFYAEIFDNTRAELKAATNINDLNLVFSTLDKIGSTFDLGTTTGYSCSPGYALSLCGDTPSCVMIEHSDVHCSQYVECENGGIEHNSFSNGFSNGFDI